MKRVLTLLVLIWLVVNSAFTQNYTYRRFPTSNDKPIWVVECQKWPSGYYIDYYCLYGDTLINNNLYSKFYFLKSGYISEKTLVMYLACIREDTLKRIFVIYKGHNHEQLLFDFSKKIGDTIFYNDSDNYPEEAPYDDYYSNIRDLVIIKDSIIKMGDSTLLRQIEFENIWYQNIIWIEGIGNINTVLSPIYSPTERNRYKLFHYQDTLINITFPGGVPFIQNNNKVLKIQVYPNPTNDQINFFSKKSKFKNIQLISPYGSIIMEIKDINSNFLIIPAENLNKGALFYRLTDEKGEIHLGKLIIE